MGEKKGRKKEKEKIGHRGSFFTHLLPLGVNWLRVLFRANLGLIMTSFDGLSIAIRIISTRFF